MKKFKIDVSGSLNLSFRVNAESRSEALNLINRIFLNTDLLINSDNTSGVVFVDIYEIEKPSTPNDYVYGSNKTKQKNAHLRNSNVIDFDTHEKI